MSENFGRIVVVDFEYEIEAGDLPNPLCMVAHVLDENFRHVQTIKCWRGEFGAKPPFDIGPNTLLVAYSAWAELTCFLVLGWKFPVHIFDAHTAYLAASNFLRPHDPDETRKKQSKKLPDACRAYGIEGWEHIDKPHISEAIGNGAWRGRYSPQEILDYCEEDVRKTAELVRAQIRPGRNTLIVDVQRVLHWSNYSAKSIALIQAKGMPIDMAIWNLILENKATVIGELLRRFDPSYGDDDPIYTPDGEWSYGRFEQFLIRHGVHAWPRLDSGRLDTDGDAFRLMSFIPGIEKLHALRDSLGVIVKANLPIGRDGRNRPSLFPFATATGRNAHARSIYNFHAGMRSLMVAPPDTIMAYLDWRTQEIGIAAALSGDPELIHDYNNGDVYHGLALTSGFTDDPDPAHWKKTQPDMRQRMKSLQLAINYGMGVPSLSRGLNRHPLIGSTVIEKHKRRHATFWAWRDAQVQAAMLDRRIESVFGWPLYISTSPNKRTLYNFPMQANGAEMLRLGGWRLCETGIVPSMLVHDAILLEVKSEEQIAHAVEIMRQVGRDVCDGFEIGVDVDQVLKGGARYQDKRDVAKEMWKTIMDVLAAIGAVPKRGAA
jgi:DNA polymerase-1